MSPQNISALLPSPKSRISLSPLPLPSPGPGKLLIRTRAVAFNPADAAIQAQGFIWDEARYPLSLGCDLAGEVVSVGPPHPSPPPYPSSKSFAPGDRVLACVERGAFENFVVADAILTAKIPDAVGFAEASVLPLCVTTAASSLFEKGNLGLRHPRLGKGGEGEGGEIVLVWGAASSVGSCAVQMLRAAGYRVAATASGKNEGYVRGLGAEWVFDYKEEGVLERIVRELEGKGESAGVFSAILEAEVVRGCAVIAGRLGGKKVVGTVAPTSIPYDFEVPEGVRIGVCNCTAEILPDSEIREVLNMPEIAEPSQVPAAVWESWLSEALESGLMRCKPDPHVVGKGLESIQEAIDLMGKGVSASKLVVEID